MIIIIEKITYKSDSKCHVMYIITFEPVSYIRTIYSLLVIFTLMLIFIYYWYKIHKLALNQSTGKLLRNHLHEPFTPSLSLFCHHHELNVFKYNNMILIFSKYTHTHIFIIYIMIFVTVTINIKINNIIT